MVYGFISYGEVCVLSVPCLMPCGMKSTPVRPPATTTHDEPTSVT